ncbi:MAG TPA: M50 family metallopeptidase [Syntrophomonadaceae bacterium]|jgi:stage IV sporulation protein FB|nr:M50 family metallopeptidase [Syntrophomonadaceae bacterium]
MLVGKIGGIRIRINLLVLLLGGLYAYLGLAVEILLILAAVLIHEIAHVIMARLLGVRVAEVDLLPFGGQAKMEDYTGLDPEQDIYLALAGPAASLSAAGIFYFLQEQIISPYLPMFININLFLGLFNLCPGLPMDGGHILRAVLSKFIGYKRATSRTAALGKIIAVGIMGWGGYQLYYQQSGINFIVVGALLLWAAHREGRLLAYAFMRYLVNKKSELAKHGLLPAQQVVSREDTLLKVILESARPNFYLVVVAMDENDNVVGMHSEAKLIECFFDKGPGARLRDC